MGTSVYELDLPEVDIFGVSRAEALAALEAARERNWLARMPLGFVVTRHADVVAILRDRRFHSALSLMPQMAGIDDEMMLERQQRSILAMEGEEHARLRRLVAPAFTPMATDRLRPFMREVMDDLIDAVADRGECELVSDICEAFPIAVICELLGAPKEDWKLFSQWATDIFRIFNNEIADDLPRIKAAFAELDDYTRAMIAERRSSPAEDLLSHLIAAEEAGDRLSNDELVMMTEAVLMAGTDTTRNQLACSVALLTEYPDQWQLLGEQPELASRSVEETMRVLGAVRGTARVTAEEVEYREVVFPTGTLVATSLVAANFDGEVWPDPHRFDITREPSRSPQMTFGSGVHYCLGASLARAELQEALPLLARRMPGIEVNGVIEWKPDSTGIWGPSRLPLRFTPAVTPA